MHELEVQKQIAARRNQLFPVLSKFSDFTPEQIVKAALLIGQDESRLNLFFDRPDDYKPMFVRHVLDGAT